MVTLICKNCKKEFEVKNTRKNSAKYCSHKCYSISLRICIPGKHGFAWRGGGIDCVCKNCGKEFKVQKCRKNKAKFCSYNCYYISMKGNIPKCGVRKGFTHWSKGKKFPERSGKNSSRWKGGETTHGGYIFVRNVNHPFHRSNGYVKRSRLVMEKHLKRYLTPKEVVHHKGIKHPIGSVENKQDDRIKNLQLFKNKSAHTKFHCHLNKSPVLRT